MQEEIVPNKELLSSCTAAMSSALHHKHVKEEELQNLALVSASIGSWQAICFADRGFKSIGHPAQHVASSPGAIDEHGYSALHLASMHGHKHVVLELMQLPLPVDARKDVTPESLWCSKAQFKHSPPYPDPALKKAHAEQRYRGGAGASGRFAARSYETL